MVAEVPGQTDVLLAVTVGGTTTVTVTALEAVHPKASVALSVYVVVTVGLTVGDNVPELVILVVGDQA